MKRKVYWKDLCHSFTSSKGRFLSILTLMMLGTLALVGLKVTTPNMHRTAQRFIDQQEMLDLAVMGDLGLDKTDQEELQGLTGASLEFSYLTDVTIDGKDEAVRLFSTPETISRFQLAAGRLPQKEDEVALAAFWKDRYQIGDQLRIHEKAGSPSVLKTKNYRIVGFVKSAEMWSEKDLGQATSGSGSLDAYGVLSKDAFTSPVYSLARIRFDDLRGFNPFSTSYQDRLVSHQKDLEKLLAGNGQERYRKLQADGKQKIQKGQEELDAANKQLADAREKAGQAQTQLTEQSNKLNQLSTLLPKEELETRRLELAEAQKQLDQQLVNIQAGESELATKQKELEKAKEDLKNIEQPNYHVYDRKTIPGGQGYLMYSNASASISAVGNLFPVVLYAVAAMVTFTTMTRFVDEERSHAGLFKALGYRTKDILAKFLLYGLVAGTVGTGIGTLLGHYVLSGTISQIITQGMVVGTSRQYFYESYSLLALGLSLLSSVFPAYLVAKRELEEEASHLLLPKPPVSGSSILLERLPFLWKRLSFTQKVTARNIFRYKQRMVMTIFGVAGSVALLFAGLGIQSSVGGVPQRQFGEILKYDMILSTKSSLTDEEEHSLKKRLKQADIKETEAIFTKQVEASYPSGRGKQSMTLMVSSKDSLEPIINLRSEEGRLDLSNGAVITSKLAQLAKVGVGDDLRIDGHTIRVAAITENYVGHFVYMNQATYQKIYGKSAKMNAYLVRLQSSSLQFVQKVSRDMMEEGAVLAVTQNTSLISLFSSVAQSLNKTMMILVLVSILLAMVILYNLTNINVAERIRELSTIKVLGFHHQEVTLYIYRETILLSLVGIGLGLLGGFYLHHFLIAMIAPDAILFYPRVALGVYLYPIAGVILILASLGILVNHHLKKIDMLEALKSVE